MAKYEKEVKFYLTDPGPVKSALMALDPVQEGRVFESNLRLEDKNQSLKEKNALLRLRKNRGTVLTYKCKDEMCTNGQVKVFREMETEVGDFDAAVEIFSALGFEPAQTYEKYRETFRLSGAVITFDTLPFGEFLEIEAETGRIRQLAKDLGLTWEDRILTNYLALFEAVKNQWGLGFSDVTFDNFKNVRVDFARIKSRFTAGK